MVSCFACLPAHVTCLTLLFAATGLPTCPSSDYTALLDSGYTCLRHSASHGSFWRKFGECYNDAPNTRLAVPTSARVLAGMVVSEDSALFSRLTPEFNSQSMYTIQYLNELIVWANGDGVIRFVSQCSSSYVICHGECREKPCASAACN